MPAPKSLHRRAVLAIVLAAYTMIVLDISIVIIADRRRGATRPRVANRAGRPGLADALLEH